MAHTLRAFHDAGRGFVPPPGGRWQWPAHEPAEVVCHNDFAPYNLMFEDGRLTGVIDLDPANPDAPYAGSREQARRLQAFCDAYGEPRTRRAPCGGPPSRD